jgi:hypothetical protein
MVLVVKLSVVRKINHGLILSTKDYNKDINTLNKDKNIENHQGLITTKRQYKHLENKFKRRYMPFGSKFYCKPK